MRDLLPITVQRIPTLSRQCTRTGDVPQDVPPAVSARSRRPGRAAAQGVDLVVIDTPARLSSLVVIPCRPLIFDLETVPTSQQVVTLAGGPPVVAVLNATPPRGRRAAETRAALEEFGIVICPYTLGQRVGTVSLTVHVPPLVRDQLKRLVSPSAAAPARRARC